MIIDHCRDVKEFYDLYIQRPLNDGLYSFSHILNNPNLFCFYDENNGKLKCYIFINADAEGNIYLSGGSVPKNMSDNVQAIIKVCKAFKQDMYSETDKKEAVYVLLRAGFKKIATNLYIKRWKNG